MGPKNVILSVAQQRKSGNFSAKVRLASGGQRPERWLGQIVGENGRKQLFCEEWGVFR